MLKMSGAAQQADPPSALEILLHSCAASAHPAVVCRVGW